MGLIALDISGFGVVMSADSQAVELLDGENRVLTGRSSNRSPILIHQGGGFRGLIGYVGTEAIDGRPMSDWLNTFSRAQGAAALPEFTAALAEMLTREWQRLGLASILEIFISGADSGEIRFWYVRNSQGLYDHSGTFRQPSSEFHAVDDLDGNYISRDLAPGQTKKQLLEARHYSFREGALLPAAPVFDAFSTILGTLYAHGIDGFEPLSSLDDLAYFARQRMEFLKRLCSRKHGIYRGDQSPIGGEVHVIGVKPDGEIRRYPKQRSQAQTLR